MTREDLLKSKEYWSVQIQSDLFKMIEDYMKERSLNRTQLAEELKVTKGYITQILNGDFDHKISKLVDLSLACGKAPVLHFVDINKYIDHDKVDQLHMYDLKPSRIKYVPIHVSSGKSPLRFNSQKTLGKSSLLYSF